MRYIPLRDQEPDAVWLIKANRLLDELKAAPDAAAKSVHRRFIHSCGDLGLCLSRQALDSSRDFWSLIYLG